MTSLSQSNHKVDPTAQKFGLPSCLLVPNAAADAEAIELYVGSLLSVIHNRIGRVNAILVQPYNYPVVKQLGVKLWELPESKEYEERLHPSKQVWVHVDYTAYRRAYIRFGMPVIPDGFVLDHIQNRKAVRLEGYAHVYLRLCPVSRAVNTSGGIGLGGEGIEKELHQNLHLYPEDVRKRVKESLSSSIVYADPMDLTKMLNVKPGSETLPGVAKMMKFFYKD